MSQIDFPFICDEDKLREFLGAWLELEVQAAQLMEEKRLIKEQYQTFFPMPGVLTALKVIRAQEKLEQHPKKPLSLLHQSVLEHTIRDHLMELEEEPAARIVPLAKTPRLSRKRLGFALVAEKEA